MFARYRVIAYPFLGSLFFYTTDPYHTTQKTPQALNSETLALAIKLGTLVKKTP